MSLFTSCFLSSIQDTTARRAGRSREAAGLRPMDLRRVAVSAFGLVTTSPAWADNPGHHPAYLHALSDLRDASGEEDQPATQGLQMRVIRHIEEARRAVRHALHDVWHGE